MNRIKRTCALLLAIVLILGVAFQPGIGGVFAENTEQTEQITELATQAGEETAAEPATEATTQPAEESAAQPVPESKVETETAGEPDVPSFYEQLMACGSLADFETLLCAEENSAALDALSQEELKQLLGHVEEISAAIAEPTEEDTLLSEELLKKLNEHIIVICLECGEAGGHAETCSQYAAESADYPWAGLTDTELAAWLMDEANADAVKAILSSDSEEYEALNSRIEAILGGEDTELARQLQEYLSVLMDMPDTNSMAMGDSSYIYFDLAAGNVTIGKSTYTGYVFVDGAATEVKGTHGDSNKYYVYQSTDVNKADTGYAKKEDFDAKQNCRIPVYNRVNHDGQSWTAYVTNNTDVKAVSTNWETAAANSGRKSTPNKITFQSESGYSADVTIDNIWSDYHVRDANRTTGGITADLGTHIGTTIKLQLKGDNRFGNIHYYAKKGTNNKIIFSDGEGGSAPEGGITVADFTKNFGANYWCSAIGGNDNGHDPSDGIVIKSGVIYAGTTSADDCTAIGGGGNEYGGVTIEGGTVTAVSASTGTAIGGGIGWGSQGGDANVLISGGTVYAYNHGIGPDSGKYTSFVPAVAIGGGSADTNSGNKNTTVTITGGFVYAQSVGGAAIGGGGSGTKTGGIATVNIESGTVIAKSVGGTVNYHKGNNMNHTEEISPGASIGGGTGNTGGGSVTLNVSEKNGSKTILRTGSIGGGKTTGSGNIGSANVTITGGDITGQVIMAGGAANKCTFEMSGGRIHDTNVIDGNDIKDIADPQPTAKIQYLQKNGGAVWMSDTIGETTITGGTIENCTAYLGGAVYMEGGEFSLSGDGTIKKNSALRSNSQGLQGYGGGVYVTGGSAVINGGSINNNKAQIRGGGVYVTGGSAEIKGGSIKENIAGFGDLLPADVGRGGGVYLEGGLFTMTGGVISDNRANYRGGGIFLTKKPDLTEGVISGNTAVDSGGGLCINGDALELTSAKMEIFGNSAKNGGGVAVLNGEFILDGGAVGVKPDVKSGEESDAESETPVEDEKFNKATEKGGGVYVKAEGNTTGDGTVVKTSATVKSGNIWYNSAKQGGGIYLDKGEGVFTLEGENASVSHNTATEGGGIYLYKDPNLNRGKIEQNTADENGGGMYISDCLVTLNPTAEVTIRGNGAKNGAGIYIHDSSPDDPVTSDNLGGSGDTGDPAAYDAITQASTPIDKRVGLSVGEIGNDYNGFLNFIDNKATVSGGAVCVNKGHFYLHSDNIAVIGNRAEESGGGVAVLKGNFTMTKGSIGEAERANTAKNGGGVYVSDGEVWFKGGSVQYNEATDGGGAYVTGGRIIMIDGSLNNNTATEKGGGAYAAGNFRMLGGTVGGEEGGNKAVNGGGVYVNEGNVYVIYGEITYNHASMDGGGFFICADKKSSDVLMLSGSLSYNTAEENGGGMAVRSDNTTSSKIEVEIGCLMYHPVENGRPQPFSYAGDNKYGEYASFDNKEYKHESCPVVEHNNAGIKGGGFYLDSDSSTISFYCIEESENTAADINGAGMDVEGGGVIIGDEAYHNHSHDQSSAGQKLDKPRGYIKTGNATMVNGGQVDIYGDMDNPSFIDEVMVDILDSAHDHFRDHRRSEEKEVYKVHYFENFGGTGLYTATEYSEPNLQFPVEGALYNRPGYEIRGWCTTAVYDEKDPNSKYYSVGDMIDLTDEKLPGMGIYEETSCDICKNHKDLTLLKLYAIWKVNGYLVHFDPNVPVGETYSGSMKDQSFNYDQEQNLAKNMFKYTGHIFAGWTINADGTGNSYQDNQSVKNLTTVAGETVTLYAKWKVCDHKDSHRWSYDVIDDEKTLRRICDCGGQTLHATLSAEDTVYDGYTHGATLTLDDKEAWGTDVPTVTYTGEWINKDIHTGVDSLLTDQNPIPLHAGIYTASITKPDEKSGGNTQNPVTASVEYTIAKADQPAPDKPDYTLSDAGGKTVTINKLAADPTELTDKTGGHQEAKAQYRLNYSGSSDVAWEYIGSEDGLTKTMDTAYTTYFVEARYEELNDYNASEITRANSAYFFAGNVRVEVECDDGIDYGEMQFSKDNAGQNNGIEFQLTLKNGYYLIKGEYAVTVQRWAIDDKGNKEEGTVGSMPVKGLNDKPSIQNIPDNSYLLIHIGEARKNPTVKAEVVPKQVFSSITGTEITIISRDSAYTAAFKVDNYVPDFYNVPKLTFDSKIPAETTIILLERQTNGAENYWYYRADSEISEVPLTAFQKMGESGAAAYAVPTLGEGEEYANLNYQFIVDFSRSAGGCSGDELSMTLEAAHIDNEPKAVKAPEIKSSVTVSMGNRTFGLTPEGTNGNGLTNSFTCTFNVEGSAAASKWDDRASALILKPANNPVLPADARIKAVIGGETTYLYKNKGSFIVPLSLLNTEKKVSLTLESALFPKEEAQYEFAAEWLVSPSKAGKAPVKGDTVGGPQEVIFKSAVKQTPSLKSEGVQRVLTTQDTLKLDIKRENLNGYFIEAKLLRKSESTGEYIETGWNTSPVGDKLEVGLAGQTPGSFCLMLYVKENEDSVAVEMRVPYYFVIKQTE